MDQLVPKLVAVSPIDLTFKSLVVASVTIVLCACSTDLTDRYYRVGVWEKLWTDGIDAQNEKRLVDARRLFESAVREIEQSKDWLKMGVTYDRLGDVYCQSKMEQEAEATYQKALSAFKTYMDKNRSEADERLALKEIVGTSKSLAPLLIEKKKFSEAEKLINNAISAAERLGGAEMQDTKDRLLVMDYAENVRCLGLLYEKTERFTEAERCYLKAARFMPALLLKDRESRLLHTIVTLQHQNPTGKKIGRNKDIDKRVRDWSSAYDAGFEAIENHDLVTARDRFKDAYLIIKAVDPCGYHAMDSLAHLIKTMNKLQQLQDSEKLVNETFSEVLMVSPSKQVDNVLGEMADTCRRTKNWSKAEAILKHQIEVRTAVRGQKSIHVAETISNLGDVYAATGKNTEAEFMYQKALKVLSDCSLLDSDLANDIRKNIEVLK